VCLQRVIPGWAVGGHATVRETFLRLVPDRQSKTGWAWCSAPVRTPRWSATVRFRVSGGGQRLFGDGWAFWFTQHNARVAGPVHGVSFSR